MKVNIDTEIFLREHKLSLARLLHFGFESRHRLFLEGPIDEYVRWHATQEQDVQEECDFIFAWSAEAETLDPSEVVINISSTPTFNGIAVSLADSFRILESRAKIWVENARTDKTFLLALATPKQRIHLKQLEAKGFLEFSNGGGIDELRQQLVNSAGEAGFALRSWVISDSDARLPNAPSEAANRLRDTCTRFSVPYHQLLKRAAENYLPRGALMRWAENNPSRKKVVRAFASMTIEQRNHYNMKNGFSADEQTDGSHANDLYLSLSPATKTTLRLGFGSAIRDSFENCMESDFVGEPGVDEIRNLLGRIGAFV